MTLIMKAKSCIFLSIFLSILSCTNDTNNIEKNDPLNGTYIGTVITYRQNSINNYGFDWRDTVEISFSINVPAFDHQDCTGQVALLENNNISFESDDCSCMCDCLPNVDCEGDILLGTRSYTFDGDSLFMLVEHGNIDSLSISGFQLGYHIKRQYSFKKI